MDPKGHGYFPLRCFCVQDWVVGWDRNFDHRTHLVKPCITVASTKIRLAHCSKAWRGDISTQAWAINGIRTRCYSSLFSKRLLYLHCLVVPSQFTYHRKVTAIPHVASYPEVCFPIFEITSIKWMTTWLSSNLQDMVGWCWLILSSSIYSKVYPKTTAKDIPAVHNIHYSSWTISTS